jgi:sigma-E factor negative regulatory protein RseB
MTTRLTQPTRRVVSTAVALVTGALVALAVTTAGSAQEVDLGNQYLREGRSAATATDFGGLIEVLWAAPGGTQRDEINVKSTDGVLALGDAGQVVIEGSTRYAKEGSGWVTLWGQAPDELDHSPSDKWELTVRGGPLIVGRSTREVTAADRDTGQVRERRYFDAVTGLQLRREQYDSDGRRVRYVSFVEITLPPADPSGSPVEKPATSEERLPEQLDAVAATYDAPELVGDGFSLNGAYERADGDGVQLFYSDGLFSVSVFEERGSLDVDDLARGATERELAGRDVHHFAMPTGTVLVWEEGGLVYTSVSDAPSDELDEIVSSFQGGESGLMERVGDFLLGPFGW